MLAFVLWVAVLVGSGSHPGCDWRDEFGEWLPPPKVEAVPGGWNDGRD